MFNLSLGILFMLVHFTLFLAAYRLFGKSGVYGWVAMASVVANIQVIKTIDMFSIVLTLGNTMYGTIYLASDLLNEKYGENAAKKAVWIGLFSLAASTIIMQLALLFERQPEDIGHEALSVIFGFMPQIAIASFCAYFVSQFLDVRLYTLLKRIFPSPGQLWIRNNGSTAISQFVDTLIFCTIAFYSEYGFGIWLSIFLSTYIIKFIVSVCSTPFLYAARSFPVRREDEPAA
jgi:conserved hypothetical integral membrane protein